MTWASRWLADLFPDVRYAVRGLSRSRRFAAVAVLTLGLGIGATTAIVSVVDAILLRPLPFRESERLVAIIQNMPPFRAGAPSWVRGFSRQEFVEWREQARTLSEMAAVATSIDIVRTRQGTARLWGGMTSGTMFSMLGAGAMLGRTLLPSDEANPNVLVLSFETWRRHFQSDPQYRRAIGRVPDRRPRRPIDDRRRRHARRLRVPHGTDGVLRSVRCGQPGVAEGTAAHDPRDRAAAT